MSCAWAVRPGLPTPPRASPGAGAGAVRFVLTAGSSLPPALPGPAPGRAAAPAHSKAGALRGLGAWGGGALVPSA